ncbi:MAG TPA: M14 family zinc carboxypeptidase, partial [Puia sp.]|nr:M14 family zinc carboxypeptidase [Puia sp.]
MRKLIFPALVLFVASVSGQKLSTPFEKSSGRETATYSECIHFYKQLDQYSPEISIKTMGMSDAGYPYHLVLFSKDGKFDPATWHKQNKVVILIINGIHPGEPDGVDASMLLLRDAASGKLQVPANIVLAVIPIYNIGGALNRNSNLRVNQNGPESYGFRGNSQNLDLNRDFTKSDSRDSKSFAEIFHWLDPDIQLDNHVSDGADYQHTMTLIATQWNKLGGTCGEYIHQTFQPELFKSMAMKDWPMCPYVNFEEGDTEKGWEEFYDSPRYSSGYAALFHVFSFISETHMLKPFKERVLSTYALMQSIIEFSANHASEIHQKRNYDIAHDMDKTNFDLGWKVDRSRNDSILFKGYAAEYKTSEITGQPRLYYNHSKPFEKYVRFFDYYQGINPVHSPDAYIIPQGWHDVIDLLRLNGVTMSRLARDSIIEVETYHIDSFSSASK